MTDSVTHKTNESTEDRPDQLAGQSPAGTHASDDEQERVIQVIPSNFTTAFTVQHKSWPFEDRSRTVVFSLSERSDIVIEKQSKDFQIDSDVLTQLFGAGDQWKFNPQHMDFSEDHTTIFAEQAEDEDHHQAELTLPGPVFRAVMQSPVPDVSARFPGEPLTAIRMGSCIIRDWDKEQVDGSRTTYSNARLEVQVDADMKAWPETVKDPCYSEDTLDAGWPGSAKKMALSAATEPEPH